MKKNHLAVFITSFLTLTGCLEQTAFSNKPLIDPVIEQSLKAETKVDFDILSSPLSPTLVLPSYLAVNQEDGTLITEYRALNPSDLGDPILAMSQVDGWSTSQGIKINFKGNALEASSAVNSFHILKSANPTNLSGTTAAQRLNEGTDYIVNVIGQTLTVTLLKPLEPSSHYLFAITNSLQDNKGNPVGMTHSYAAIKANIPPPPTLLAAQAITHSTENIFEQMGVDKSTIIFSSWFTTLSVGDVLLGAKSATALALDIGAKNVWKGSAIAPGITTDLDKLFTMSEPTRALVPDDTTKLGNKIYIGQISLPYYLEILPDQFLSSPWKSGMPSLAKIRYVLTHGNPEDKKTIQTQLIELGIDPLQLTDLDAEAKTQVIRTLTGETLTLANGERLDLERIMTRDSTIPMLRSVQTIEYTLVLPKKEECQLASSNAVTIYQHGITSDKKTLTSSFLADKLIGDECRAIIAINHPLHGDRGIGNLNAAKNPLMYLNLDSLTVGRDNIRQSTIDLINLRASIGKVFKQIETQANTLSILGRLNPTAGVSYVGHSLGAMVGITAANISNRPISDPEIEKLYFNIDKAALANPGGSIPYLLINSGFFGNLMKGLIADKINPDYATLCEGKNPLFCYSKYEKNLINEGSPASLKKLANMYASFRAFSYAAQTIFDTVDPTNHAPLVPDLMPIYLSQVKNDMTVPNYIPENKVLSGTDILLPYSPFAGTMPLLKTLALSQVTTSINGQLIKSAALFKKGLHSSLLDSINTAVPKEMHIQIHSFLNGNGNSLRVDNPALLESSNLK